MGTENEARGNATVSTGQAAEALGVSAQTIIRLFDEGGVAGFRIPGSRFRRIYLDALLEYAKRYNLRVDQDALSPRSPTPEETR